MAGSADDQIKAVIAQHGAFVATVDADQRFVRLIDRAKLADAVARGCAKSLISLSESSQNSILELPDEGLTVRPAPAQLGRPAPVGGGRLRAHDYRFALVFFSALRSFSVTRA